MPAASAASRTTAPASSFTAENSASCRTFPEAQPTRFPEEPHYAAVAWAHFSEEAADEAAVKWTNDYSGKTYGEALMQSLRKCQGGLAPAGAFAIVESAKDIARRMLLIGGYERRSPKKILAGALSLTIVASVCSVSAVGYNAYDPKAAVVESMQAWLKEIDGGRYEQSWDDSSTYFRRNVSSALWLQGMNRDRASYGKCNYRHLVSVQFIKNPALGFKYNGVLANAQFESSYANMKYTVDTVTFILEADGTWKALGYYCLPRR